VSHLRGRVRGGSAGGHIDTGTHSSSAGRGFQGVGGREWEVGGCHT
jgi:hypothetical protein